MKWPWVSRGVYEITQALVIQEHNAAMNIQIRFDALLEKYHTLKVSGASVPEPAPTLHRPEFDAVQAAITAKAGPEKRLRAMMSREAMQSRAAGIPDIEIIQAIEQGVTMDDENIV